MSRNNINLCITLVTQTEGWNELRKWVLHSSCKSFLIMQELIVFLPLERTDMTS